ncbi:hypothetical protein GEMRC1_009314 [Eukaryota sp. GEM-RC1]
MIYDSFLFSSECDVVIDSFYCENSNFENSVGLFQITDGSINISNFNIGYSTGPLFLLHNVESSLFDQIHLSDLNSGTVFLFVQSNVSLSNISVFYSSVNTIFKTDNSNLLVDGFSSTDLKSSSMFDGTASVFDLHDVSISNLTTSIVFDVFDIKLILDYFNISDSVLTSGFLVSVSSNSSFMSMNFELINTKLGKSNEYVQPYLFDLIGGSLLLENSTFEQIYGNLFFWNQQLYLSNLFIFQICLDLHYLKLLIRVLILLQLF